MEESYWNTDYWHAMDRSKGKENIININPQQIGISSGIGDPLQGLRSRIFMGASQVELGFMGAGKGSRTSPAGWTPESVSVPEREAIRQLAKINEITLSTHATPSVAISGFTEQGFSEERREGALHEIKKAIDFAADTAGGGPVVLHAQEFPRSIAEKYMQEKFIHYPGEEEKATLYFVNEKTKRLVTLSKDVEVPVPKTDEKGEIVRDEEGRIQFETQDFTFFEKKFNELPEEIRRKKYDNSVGKYLYEQVQERNIQRAIGESEFYDVRARELEKTVTRMKDLLSNYDKVLKSGERGAAKVFLDESLKLRFAPDPTKHPEEFEEFRKDPEKFLKKEVIEEERTLQRFREGAIAHGREAEHLRKEIERLRPIEEFGVQQSAQAIGRAALHGYNLEKSQDLERPIIIVPENWTPELYGSHPQELKKLVKESRKSFVEQLVKEKHMERGEAEKIAEERIKSTFDIGHVNMWRKYFQGSDKEFKNWVDEQVQDLLRNKIIGHVHLTDNFGYHDEHLTPGEGTAPVKEFLQRLETEGFKGTIVAEPGGQPEGQIHKSLTGSWGLSHFPLYRVGRAALSWSEIEGSYFGKTEGPRFVVGDYAPSKEWTLWSEIPLE